MPCQPPSSLCEYRDPNDCRWCPPHVRRDGPSHLGGHTSAVSLASGVLVALVVAGHPRSNRRPDRAANVADRRRGGARADLRRRGAGDPPDGRGRRPVERLDRAARPAHRRGRRRGFAGCAIRGGATAPADGEPIGASDPRSSSPPASCSGAVAHRFAAIRGMPQLAIDSEHLGLGLARQHDPVHPRDRAGVTDPHGRAAQRRDPRRALLPVDVPRAGRDPVPAHRRRRHHRVHVELAGRRGLAVPGQRGGADVAPAAQPRRRPVAGGGLRRPPPRRWRPRSPRSPTSSSTPRRCPTWRPTASAVPTLRADRLGAAAPRPHPAGRARAASACSRCTSPAAS